MIASGGGLLEADLSTIRKDISVPGEGVDSFAAKPRQVLRGIPVQPIPVSRVAALVVSAIEPHVASDRHRTLREPDGAGPTGFSTRTWLFVYRTGAVLAVRGRRGAGIHALEKSRRISRAGAGAGRGVDLVRSVDRRSALRCLPRHRPGCSGRRSAPLARRRTLGVRPSGRAFVTRGQADPHRRQRRWHEHRRQPSARRPCARHSGGARRRAQCVRRAARRRPFQLVGSRPSADAPGWFSASVAERWRNERPSTVIAAGLAPLDARALDDARQHGIPTDRLSDRRPLESGVQEPVVSGRAAVVPTGSSRRGAPMSPTSFDMAAGR